jgi:hypothetical protein
LCITYCRPTIIDNISINPCSICVVRLLVWLCVFDAHVCVTFKRRMYGVFTFRRRTFDVCMCTVRTYIRLYVYDNITLFCVCLGAMWCQAVDLIMLRYSLVQCIHDLYGYTVSWRTNGLVATGDAGISSGQLAPYDIGFSRTCRQEPWRLPLSCYSIGTSPRLVSKAVQWKFINVHHKFCLYVINQRNSYTAIRCY